MKTQTFAHVRLIDAKGVVLHRRSVDTGVALDSIDGETAARTALVELTLENRPQPDPEFGSPAALASYRSQSMRELALDQLRRGLEITGAYDPHTLRCLATSPEGAHCTLAQYHGSIASMKAAGTDVDPHERCADTRRPREIAEVWTDADMEPAPGADVPKHFTAWMTNDTSCLDQLNCDVSVIEDDLTGELGNKNAWTSAGTPPVYYGVTSVNAKDGDVEEALTEAMTMLLEAGWSPVDGWEATTSAYTITVQRIE